ncbi:MAG: peptide chain release factor family protein [Phycisphaerae bacterium]
MGTDNVRSWLLLSDEALQAQCEMDHYRARGPGGQKRNKTSSAVRLRHIPTGLAASAEDDRSQHVNRRRAMRRLRRAIAMEIRAPIVPEAFVPSARLQDALTQDGQIRMAEKNPNYFPVIGEILDLIFACNMRVSDAARRLDISTAHLVRFIEADFHVWRLVNDLRRAEGLKPLHGPRSS